MEKFSIDLNVDEVFKICKNMRNLVEAGDDVKKVIISDDGKTATTKVPVIGEITMKLTANDEDKTIRISCSEIGCILAGKVSETITDSKRGTEIKLVVEKCRPNISILKGGAVTENIIKAEAPSMLKKIATELEKRLKKVAKFKKDVKEWTLEDHVDFSRELGIPEDEIIKNIDELDKFMGFK